MEYYALSYVLIFAALAITLIAQAFVSGAYSRYSKEKNMRGITGAEAARMILDKYGLYSVKIEQTSGHLTDHYDPRKKVLRLSGKVHSEASVASVAVACHECGHALQDASGYAFLRLRAFLVPITTFASYAGYFAILVGCIFDMINVIWLGIIAEGVILLFELVTLPVEINASRRALKEIEEAGFLEDREYSAGKRMLAAAAMTYVASVANTLLQILRLVLIFGGRKRD